MTTFARKGVSSGDLMKLSSLAWPDADFLSAVNFASVACV
jgi:hypothetical protein